MRILCDPGHGGHDPGVTDPATGLVEKYAAFITVLTLRYLLEQAGHDVLLTRIDDRYVPLAERPFIAPADLFLSVHYDWLQGRALLYHAQNHEPSSTLGNAIAKELGIPSWPTSHSRFGRLYIDDFPGVSLLWETATISEFQPSREWRLKKCEAFVKALLRVL